MESIDPALADEDYCYLTTRGRVTGRWHTVEIWFALNDDTLYLLAGSRERTDWVKNIQKDPNVTIRIADRRFAGRARVVEDAGEDALARRLLVSKYRERYRGDLSDWGRTALPVAVDIRGEA